MNVFITWLPITLMRNTILLWLALVAVSAAVIYAPQEKPDLRIGVLKTVDTVHPFIAEQQGYYKAEGLNVKIYSFGTSPALAEAIASGDIDIAYMSFAPAATWISKGTDMKILAGASRGGDIVCVRENTTNGTIAVSNKGTMTENIYRTIVADKLPFKPIYGIEPADMTTALMVTHSIDAAFVWEPFASKIEDGGGTCILDAGAEWKKEHGSMYQRNVLVATGRVLADKSLVEKVLRVHNKTIEFLNSPGSDAAIANAMGIAPLRIRRSEYNSTLDWPSMQIIMETAKSEGYLKNVLSKEELVYEG
jgi:NitT/TauT family transport system substrate-binding protein